MIFNFRINDFMSLLFECRSEGIVTLKCYEFIKYQFSGIVR